MKHILVVDDELGPRASLKAVLADTYDVTLADSAKAAKAVLAKRHVDLILLDVIMPEQDGISLLREVQQIHPDMPAVMISASPSVRPVVEAMRIGAFDYVSKPFDVEEIKHIVRRALESTALHRRVETLKTEVEREFPVSGIVGSSETFKKALEHIEKAARTDATVLIYGESGTGKELAARLLHTLSARREEPFVAVHCGALPETLMESELFGHEKGAFTNADKMKPGRFDLAGAGTLFFDEASEMSLQTQVKLLRVLQEREFMRVGGTRVIRTEARIVAATAKDLRDEVKAGRFRDDLYYRIGVVPVHLPPLRERTGDIPLLAEHFRRQYAGQVDALTTEIGPQAMQLMCAYEWPGNIRELRNVIERMLVLHGREPVLQPQHLPDEFHDVSRPPADVPIGSSLGEVISNYEKTLIEKALAETGGVQTRAAERLGTTRRILRYRMEKLGLLPGARAADEGTDDSDVEQDEAPNGLQ